MKQVNQVLTKIQNREFPLSNETAAETLNTSKSLSEDETSLEHEIAMVKLWEMLLRELGKGFTSQYGVAGEAAFKHWTHELSEFSEAFLVKGLERFKRSGSTYISLNVLRNHCRAAVSESLGIDDFPEAHEKIIFRAWEQLHPAFQCIAAETIEINDLVKVENGKDPVYAKTKRSRYEIGSLKRMSNEQAEKVTKRLYAEVVKRVMAGEQFERPQALEDQSRKQYTAWARSAKGQSIINQLRAQLGY